MIVEKRDAKGLTEEEFLRQYDPDKYPKPSLTADIVVFRTKEDSSDPEVLLIVRKGHPFLGCHALPGGFSNSGETIEETAARELEEETGVKGLKLSLVGIYSAPGRDPRGWTVSAAYMAEVNADLIRPKAGDDAAAVCWAQVKNIEGKTCICMGDKQLNDRLAFDHCMIIQDAFSMLTP